MDWQTLLESNRTLAAEIVQGGGSGAIQRQHAKQRLTARERIDQLVDPGATFLELGLWSAWDMYSEWGGAAAAGVICGIARVSDRTVMVIANGRYDQGRRIFPHDSQEGPAGSTHRHGQPSAAALPRRLGGRVLAAAVRSPSRTKTTSGVSFATTPSSPPCVFRRSRPSWAIVLPAADTCRCCATRPS